MTDDPKSKKPLPLWRRIALTLIVIAMIGIACVMLADFITARSLGNKIVQIQKEGEPLSFSQLESTANISSADDAATIYTSVINSIDTTDIQTIAKENAIYRTAILTGNLNQVPTEMHQKISNDLNQFRSSMLQLDRASKADMSNFDIGISHGSQACTEKLTKIQKTMQLLSLRTLFFVAMNETDKAGDSIVTMLRAERMFDTYPIVTAAIVKLQFMALACDDIILLMRTGKLPEQATEQILKVFAEIDKQQTLTKALLTERVYQIEGVRKVLPGFAQDMLSGDSKEFPDRIALPSSTRARIRLRMTISNYLNEMNDIIQASSKPWPELLSFVEKKQNDPSVKENKQIAKAYTLTSLAAATTTIIRCTTVVLNIEKYRQANLKFPESLNDLAIDIPDDPYTGQALKYKIDATGYLVYGAGPDKIDNGGDIKPQISSTTGKVEKNATDIGIKIVLPTQ